MKYGDLMLQKMSSIIKIKKVMEEEETQETPERKEENRLIKEQNYKRITIFKRFISHILYIISEGIKLEKFDIFENSSPQKAKKSKKKSKVA